MAKKKKEKKGMAVGKGWMDTYSDMITLCLCFFVAMYEPNAAEPSQLAALASTFAAQGAGASVGGTAYSAGKLANLGASVMSLLSSVPGRALGDATQMAVSLFSPDIKSNKVRVTSNERGLIISLAGDAFFNPASARINIDQTRDILLRLANLLNSEAVAGRTFRIEGHTDDAPIDPNGPWESNWELSTARSISVLHYLSDLGVDENRFQVAGFADTVPVATNDSPEGRAYNRRVDVVILTDGHL
ncbi:MAG: flagellar motor protein MotB [Spirochaetaceae bacterium]|jgi:chemotaxis protein MotB|nr:flagellar motor protein MotB [Spirochaetaceae bacterium]